MSKEKKLEEMASIAYPGFDHQTVFSSIVYAQPLVNLYKAGYRKQSEGEWIAKHHMSRSSRGRYTSYNTYTCSVCGKANGRRKTPFCPHCGAKMKGD